MVQSPTFGTQQIALGNFYPVSYFGYTLISPKTPPTPILEKVLKALQLTFISSA